MIADGCNSTAGLGATLPAFMCSRGFYVGRFGLLDVGVFIRKTTLDSFLGDFGAFNAALGPILVCGTHFDIDSLRLGNVVTWSAEAGRRTPCALLWATLCLGFGKQSSFALHASGILLVVGTHGHVLSTRGELRRHGD